MKAVISIEGFTVEKKYDTQQACPALTRLGNGETVFERQVRILSECNITKFLIAAGKYRESMQKLVEKKKFSRLDFAWTDDPLYCRTSGIFSFDFSAVPPGEELLILSGGLIFNYEFARCFVNDQAKTLVAVKNARNAHARCDFVQVEQGYIKRVLSEQQDDCFMTVPFIKLGSETPRPSEIVAFASDDYYIEELDFCTDLKRIIEEISWFDINEQPIFVDYYGFMAIERLFLQNCVKKPMVVHDVRGKVFRLLQSYLDTLECSYILFDAFSNVPAYKQLLEGAKLFYAQECDFILSFGGDSAADAAKLIRLFSRPDFPEDFRMLDVASDDIKHLAIPDGLGTGSEFTPTATFFHDSRREKVTNDSLLPDYVILEPQLLCLLEEQHKKSIALDIICRCVESLWAVAADKKSKECAKEALALTLENLFLFLRGDLAAAQKMLVARKLCEKAIYKSGVTAAYTISSELSRVLSISRGCATALFAPFFWRYYADNLSQCRSIPGQRKKVAATLGILKKTFGVNSNYELTELIYFLTVHILKIDLSNWRKELSLERLTEYIGEVGFENTPVAMGKEEIRSLLSTIIFERTSNYCYYVEKETAFPESWTEFLELWKSRLIQAVADRAKKERLEILDKVTEICEGEGLTYFLAYETLLGAACCCGFISWNDNVEISMPRKDCLKFISIAGERLKPDYYIHSSYNDKNCWFDSIRVCKEKTYLDTKEDSPFYSPKKGVYITIHPLDNASKNHGVIQWMRHKTSWSLDVIIQMRLNPACRKLGYKGQFALALSHLLRIGKLRALQRWIQTVKKNENAPYRILGNRYSVQREVISKELFFPPNKLEFQGRFYNVPGNWELVLEHLYGDYRNILLESVDKLPRPRRAWFDSPYHLVCFPTVKKMNFNLSSQLAKNAKPSIRIIVRNGLRKILNGPKQLMTRICTRICGFFRTKGVLLNENSRRLASYQNKYAGRRCFLIGNGPSLTADDLDKLTGEITFGCNLIYKVFEQTKWRPTFYCISDSTITRTHSWELVDNIDGSQLMIREYAYRYMEVRPWNAILLPYISVDWYKVRGNILAYHYISHATVMSMMIELAIYMGFREIYLIGVDGTSASSKGSHFTDGYVSSEMKIFADSVKRRVLKEYNPQTRAAYLQKRSLDIFAQLHEFSKRQGVKIYNATRGGIIEEFERVNLDEIIEK